jgi:hypothetical protein
MNNMDRNICRTMTPAIVGAIVAWVTMKWMTLPTNYLAVLTPLATTAYYTAVRFAEEKWPKASWLLGCLPVKLEVPVVPEPVVRKPRKKAEPKA